MAKKVKSPTEDRDQQYLRRLSNINHKIDSIEQTLAFSLRANAEEHFESLKEIFGSSERRAQVYLAADGQQSVQDIAKLLGMIPQAVSRALGELKSEGLVKVLEQEGGKSYWGKNPLDRTLRISQFLKREYGLDDNGLPSK